MRRAILPTCIALAFVSFAMGQDLPVGTLPPGPAPGPTDGSWLVNALFVQANLIEGGEVMFLVPLKEEDPENNPPAPMISVKVDGKTVRAFGVDRKTLNLEELDRRLARRDCAIVVHSQPPDPFFLKALHDQTVIFVVSRRLFQQMAETIPPDSLEGWWAIANPNEATPALNQDHWVIDAKKIAVHQGEKLVGTFSYRFSASNFPRTIELVPDHGPAKGKILKGIYDRGGNSLRICHISPTVESPENSNRPKDFGEPGTVTIDFRRLEP